MERQLQLSRTYAEEHGLVLDDKHSYQDLGKSAFTSEHVKEGEFGVFLEFVKQGRVPKGSVLLVESLDRLSRESVLTAFKQFQEILDAGIKIVTLSDKMEYTKEGFEANIGNIFISLGIMARANEESLRKSERICAAWRLKRKNLHNIKLTANCPGWLELTPDKKDFILKEDRVEIVKQIFELSLSGLGVKAISTILNKQKIEPFRSKIGWYQTTVRKILSNSAVIGEFQPHVFGSKHSKPVPDGELIKDYFPPIIDTDTFYAVQAKLKNGAHRPGRTAKVENLFSGYTRCGYCGSRMDVVARHNVGGEVRYLVCDSARRGVKCSYISMKCNEIEKAFFEYCREIDIRYVLRAEQQADQNRLNELRKSLTARNGKLMKVQKQIDMLNVFLDDITERAELEHYHEQIKKKLEEKTNLSEEIEKLSKGICIAEYDNNNIDVRVQNLLTLDKAQNKSVKEDDKIMFRIRLRDELRQIISQILVYPRGSVFSDEQIEQKERDYEIKIKSASDSEKHILKHEKTIDLDGMRQSQQNTKDDRFFVVRFKNGNYRTIKYDKKQQAYRVTSELINDKLNWWMGNKEMAPIFREEEELHPFETEFELDSN